MTVEAFHIDTDEHAWRLAEVDENGDWSVDLSEQDGHYAYSGSLDVRSGAQITAISSDFDGATTRDTYIVE